MRDGHHHQHNLAVKESLIAGRLTGPHIYPFAWSECRIGMIAAYIDRDSPKHTNKNPHWVTVKLVGWVVAHLFFVEAVVLTSLTADNG